MSRPHTPSGRSRYAFDYGYGTPYVPPRRPERNGLLARAWRRLREELAYVAGLHRLWLIVAIAGFVLGYVLGAWFGHDLAAQARLQ